MGHFGSWTVLVISAVDVVPFYFSTKIVLYTQVHLYGLYFLTFFCHFGVRRFTVYSVFVCVFCLSVI